MATIIWCDRKQHIVQEPRTQVEERLTETYSHTWTTATGEEVTEERERTRGGFVYFTPVNSSTQRALRASAITSFEAVPGDGI